MIWYGVHPQFQPEMLGFIPMFLSDANAEPAAKQIDANYQQGGGWRPIRGFTKGALAYGTTIHDQPIAVHHLQYPGDPELKALAFTRLRDELIVFYDCEILAIFQKDGSFEAARLD
jgi:hypothetical protein